MIPTLMPFCCLWQSLTGVFPWTTRAISCLDIYWAGVDSDCTVLNIDGRDCQTKVLSLKVQVRGWQVSLSHSAPDQSD